MADNRNSAELTPKARARRRRAKRAFVAAYLRELSSRSERRSIPRKPAIQEA